MDSVKLSSKFELVIPHGPRERLGLRPGMTFTVFDRGGILIAVPQRPARAYRGIARGTTPHGLRDKNDRVR